MDTLTILEEKIALLVEHVKKLQSEKKDFAKAYEDMRSQHDQLTVDQAQLAEENAQLSARVKETEHSSAKGSKKLEELSKERELTKVAVDDLIKSIDGLVNSEKQQ